MSLQRQSHLVGRVDHDDMRAPCVPPLDGEFSGLITSAQQPSLWALERRNWIKVQSDGSGKKKAGISNDEKLRLCQRTYWEGRLRPSHIQ